MIAWSPPVALYHLSLTTLVILHSENVHWHLAATSDLRFYVLEPSLTLPPVSSTFNPGRGDGGLAFYKWYIFPQWAGVSKAENERELIWVFPIHLIEIYKSRIRIFFLQTCIIVLNFVFVYILTLRLGKRKLSLPNRVRKKCKHRHHNHTYW